MLNNNNNNIIINNHQHNQQCPNQANCKGLEINRKKSKSVTFMDSIGGNCSSKTMNRNIKSEKFNIKTCGRLLPPRSKSTTPCSSSYNQYSYISPHFDSDDFVIADVDDPDDFDVPDKFRNCLIEPINKESHMLTLKKPNVGITPQTRFRRAHTLDLIRSTQMPLENNVNLPQMKRVKCHYEQFNKGMTYLVLDRNI
jgi:hypothetical protein